MIAELALRAPRAWPQTGEMREPTSACGVRPFAARGRLVRNEQANELRKDELYWQPEAGRRCLQRLGDESCEREVAGTQCALCLTSTCRLPGVILMPCRTDPRLRGEQGMPTKVGHRVR